jgi:23S rRNA (uracil1939-C5)-methyltransferase
VLTPGETLALTIDKPAAGGRMIARADGQVVLVSGAIPGERARVRIERIAKGVAYGATIELEDASPDRREPFGDQTCGGSLYSHIAYRRQLAIKSEVISDAFTRIGRLAWPAPIDVSASREEGYRMRARLHLRDRRIGFFREGSHQICDARTTRQLLPPTCDVLDEIAAALRALDIRAEIELSESADASARVVHFETERPVASSRLAGVAEVAGLTGVTVSQPQGGALHATPVGGDAYVRDVVSVGGADVVLRRHVLSFFQNNRYLLRGLVSHIVDQIPSGNDVIDLYSGVGLFAMAAAVARGARVTAVEGDSFSAADLATNAAATNGAVVAVHQAVEAFVNHRRPAPSVLIVDPPRTGMSRDALGGAIGLGARRIVYVSCDVATLARDARRFVDAGYVIERIDGFDLFPNTPHVETVAVFGAANRS